MALFKFHKTDAEKAQAHMQKELERVAKAQRKFAAQEHKAQQARAKQAAKEAKREQKERQEAVNVAQKASRTRIRLARKADKQRAQRAQAQQDTAGGVVPPPFSKSAGCAVCGKKFARALHRRRHHCRQCRESCCLQCTSRTRRAVPRFGLQKPQKVCVVCETLVFNDETQPREPAEAVAALAAGGRARRPHSAPLPPTDGVAPTPVTTRGRARARSSKRGSMWTLPIRPLLKRKKSAEQLRNRKLDQDLQLEKRMMLGGRAIELQPQTAP